MIERRDGRSIDRKTQEYVRINCIERWLAGEDPQNIIAGTGFCHTTIYKWIELYEKGGFDALKSTKAPGVSPKLNEKQRQQLREMIVGKNPRQYGFDFGLWTRGLIRDLVEEKFGVKMGLTATGALLARLEITPQKPLKRAYERDPQAIEQWRNKQYPRIRAEAAKTNAEIIFWDEAGYRLDDQVGRSWGARGQTPVVEATGKRGRTNSAIAMSPHGAFWYEEFESNLNSKQFCDLLERFMRARNRKVILIIDSHPAHTSKATRAHFEEFGDRLSVEYLPGYAPELNPVEYVNHYVKKEGPRKQIPEDRNHLSEIVTDTLAGLKGAFGKVKAFFRHPELSYI